MDEQNQKSRFPGAVARSPFWDSCLATLINNLTFDCWVMDSNFQYVLQNEYSVQHWGNVIGKNLDDLGLPLALAETWKNQALQSYQGETVCSEYSTFLDGEEHFLESVISPVKVAGTIQGIIGITRDISSFKKTEAELGYQKSALKEVNTALRVVLHNMEQEKKDANASIMFNLQTLVLPLLDKIHVSGSVSQKLVVEEIQATIATLTSSFASSFKTMGLTTKEVQVANLIQHGKTTKEIADFMGVAPSTINSHRNNIRDKVGLKNTATCLKSYLTSLG